ncbi:MAG: ATP-binding cassette domain-containing protein [Bacteroidales bacterium]|nr:ATP-binding cassette domain-containing protein [Bacteroidales bacterium]
MSEEILNALIQLLAIIAKQDDGVHMKELDFVESFLTQQLGHEAVQDYLTKFKEKAEIGEFAQASTKKKKLTPVKESVRTLALCRKINKTLDQNQKIVVLVRLFEMVNTSRQFTEQRMAIIDTVAEVFNISKEEYDNIRDFVIENDFEKLDKSSILIIDDVDLQCEHCLSIKTEHIDGILLVLRIASSELYFMRYTGSEAIQLNGLPISNQRIYLYATGSTLKLPKGKPIYYSDVVAKFLSDINISRLSFNVIDVHYKFPTGDIGLRRVNLSETQGKLIGILGASGSGKTTLLNILSGIYTPTSGEVLINSINLHKEKEKLEGLIGYIPQDDLLIEELSVFQNLYYSAKLCFRDKGKAELTELVNKTLQNLGLDKIKHLKVGNVFNKLISGGQRKRLNIALELIREPLILFVDEPTSGLSSRDSENVMDLLRELALKGKLIFVVIHQPSSDIYKMFDNMMILDTGGYQIYYGNPVEAIMYFKSLDKQVNSDVGECPVCGTVKPELIFDIIESKVVDEFGRYTPNRKVTPPAWSETYYNSKDIKRIEIVEEEPQKTLNLPNWFNQFKIFLTRDILSKLSNTQYIVLSMTEAPLLGLILAFLIRYIADPNSSKYIFFDNENIPPYIFMSIVVALFLGLTVSAEEIFRDRKILKREKFLNLSRSGYLISKIIILITISAIQALEYVLIGNTILGIIGMGFYFWLALFSTFVYANMLGLNISATFNSAVTIYILIPLIMIPLMALGGAMFSFSKLNRKIGSVDKVPIVAEFMQSRWAYEAIMVHQFKSNKFESYFFELDKDISTADFMQVHWIPEIENNIIDVLDGIDTKDFYEDANADSIDSMIIDNLALVKNEIEKELNKTGEKVSFDYVNSLTLRDFDEDIYDETIFYLEELKAYYGTINFQKDSEKEAIKIAWASKHPGVYIMMRNKYENEHLKDIVTNTYEKYKILRYKDKLVRQAEPIFQDPDDTNFIGFRSHFYAPRKYFMGRYYDTFWFNMFVIWFMTLMLYPPLYFEHFKKGLAGIEKLFKFIRKRKKRK